MNFEEKKNNERKKFQRNKEKKEKNFWESAKI